jgi:hypothetical protein
MSRSRLSALRRAGSPTAGCPKIGSVQMVAYRLGSSPEAASARWLLLNSPSTCGSSVSDNSDRQHAHELPQSAPDRAARQKHCPSYRRCSKPWGGSFAHLRQNETSPAAHGPDAEFCAVWPNDENCVDRQTSIKTTGASLLAKIPWGEFWQVGTARRNQTVPRHTQDTAA